MKKHTMNMLTLFIIIAIIVAIMVGNVCFNINTYEEVNLSVEEKILFESQVEKENTFAFLKQEQEESGKEDCFDEESIFNIISENY